MALADRLGARVLVLDIETKPWLGWGFGVRDQYISPQQIVSPPSTMAWSAQWLGEKKVRWASDHHDGHDDMVAGMYELLSSADVTIGYNHVSFDLPRLDEEFQLAGLPRLPPARHIDLLKEVRRTFKGLPHKKLSAVAEHFGLESAKIVNDGWGLWIPCCTDQETGLPYIGPVPKGGGCETSWRRMRTYGRGDTIVTMELYLHLRQGGWIKNHPHLGLFGGDLDGCPTCGGSNLTQTGTTSTPTATYPALRCGDCGALSRPARRLGNTTGTRAI